MLYIACGLALFLTLLLHMLSLTMPFDFITADVSNMARSFVRHGVLAMGGIPINNNDPVGLSPDLYLHWPPLLPILLSGWFRAFGISEISANTFSLLILLATAAVLYRLADRCLSTVGALLALLFYLTLPVVITRSHVVGQQALAIFFLLLTLLAFFEATNRAVLDRSWSTFACIAMALAMWSSWEPVGLPLSLLAVAAWRRNRDEVRLAKLLCLVCIVSLGSVALVYVTQAPHEFTDTLHTLLYRMGLSKTYSLAPLHRHSTDSHVGIGQLARNLAQFYPEMLGIVGLAAVVWVIAMAADNLSSVATSSKTPVFAGLLGTWFIWYATMWNHVGIHRVEMLLAAPGVAMAMAYCGTALIDYLQSAEGRNFWRTTVVLVLVPVLFMVPLVSGVREYIVRDRSRNYLGVLPVLKLDASLSAPNRAVRFANLVRASTPPGSVVISSIQTVVPVFYSDRHFIRNIMNDSELSRTLPRTTQAFPNTPVFLALPTEAIQDFAQASTTYPEVAQTSEVVIYELNREQ